MTEDENIEFIKSLPKRSWNQVHMDVAAFFCYKDYIPYDRIYLEKRNHTYEKISEEELKDKYFNNYGYFETYEEEDLYWLIYIIKEYR